MRIVAALSAMEVALVDAGAPRRQLRGVADWRSDVVAAVRAGSGFAQPPGMSISDQPRPTFRGGWAVPRHILFLRGERTHAAWVRLCKAILDALRAQEVYAARISSAAWTRHALAVKANRTEPSQANADAANEALLLATAADLWFCAASTATHTGRCLLRQENKIMRPVGLAIARAGGVHEVARDRYYHQAGSR